MPDYGRLSNRSVEEMEAGARVDVAPYKRDAMDFVLWKPSSEGQPAWDSPCGIKTAGRPGWHIECSAMSKAHLGEVFDIHGGGIDLVFPHHENEVAQTRCAHDSALMARVWMHNGFLQVEGEKMAKSLGNFVTINELLRDWPGEVLRWNMLRTHYRQPIDWTVKGLEESAATLASLFPFEVAWSDADEALAEGLVAALSDDLNTPKVFSEIHRLDRAGDDRAVGFAMDLLGFTGETLSNQQSEIAARKNALTGTVEPMIDARNAARATKNFAEADRIRDELAEKGITLKDGPEGTTWEVSR